MPATVFIPQVHRPGEETEVDFGEFTVKLRGELVICYRFSLRLSHSGKAVHRVSISAGQEAFFEGRALAFAVLGGDPTGQATAPGGQQGGQDQQASPPPPHRAATAARASKPITHSCGMTPLLSPIGAAVPPVLFVACAYV